ncbi:MAG: hypothetical protein J5778_02460 [Clostridiales bacterium]|nr:hypothetical protein [Clostridiales bacterium]
MNDWLRELLDNNTGRNYWYNTEIYNPSRGILYLYPILGFGSIALTFYCFMQFSKYHDVFVPSLLGIFSLVLGVAGLIMSFMNLPYSIRSKSIHMLGGCILGVFASLGGILFTIMLYIHMFVPNEVILQFMGVVG